MQVLLANPAHIAHFERTQTKGGRHRMVLVAVEGEHIIVPTVVCAHSERCTFCKEMLDAHWWVDVGVVHNNSVEVKVNKIHKGGRDDRGPAAEPGPQ